MVRYKNHYPETQEELSDLRVAVKKYLLPGYAPEKPLLTRSAPVFTLGSCFAANIHQALTRAGCTSVHLSVDEMNNTPAFLNLFVARLKGSHLGKLVADTNMITEQALVTLRGSLPQARAFVVTLGVAVQPFEGDRPSFFTVSSPLTKRTLLANEWRMLSVDEILNYVRATVNGLQAMRPGVPIVLTLSPIPLMNAMNHPSVIGQDCVSKSRIRVAIDDLMDEGIAGLYYWPSFEIVRWLGGHVGPFFGIEGVDHRHVAPSILDLITDLFIEYYFEPAGGPAS